MPAGPACSTGSPPSHGASPGSTSPTSSTNAAFVLDGALDSGRIRESHADCRDPATPHGRIVASCADAYAEAVGISVADLDRLRLLAWIVHSRSDHRHLEMAAAGPPSQEALRSSGFLGLVEAELDSSGSAPTREGR